MNASVGVVESSILKALCQIWYPFDFASADLPPEADHGEIELSPSAIPVANESGSVSGSTDGGLQLRATPHSIVPSGKRFMTLVPLRPEGAIPRNDVGWKIPRLTLKLTWGGCERAALRVISLVLTEATVTVWLVPL